MAEQTNPRKIGRTAGMTYVSIPDSFRTAIGLDPGDRVVLEETDDGFRARRVEWEVTSG